MKKIDIMNLIASKEGTLRVNPICSLRRWTVDPLGNEPVDKLTLDFDAINGMGRFAGIVEIHSRQYVGINAEIESAIRVKTQELTDYLCKALRNGYTI